jgi:Trpc4-associated protein
VVKAVMAAQLTGRGIGSIRQLPRAVYSRCCAADALAPLCMDLEGGLVGNHVEACQRVLAGLQHSLCEWNNPDHARNREAFVLFGGDVLLLRALLYPFSRDDGVEKPSSSKVLSVRRDCLSLLRELCSSVPLFPENLAAKPHFITHLFTFMNNNITFDQGQKHALSLMFTLINQPLCITHLWNLYVQLLALRRMCWLPGTTR